MDRFIDDIFQIRFIIDLHLKSNMDRFIDAHQYYHSRGLCNLKSNMDRFIEIPTNTAIIPIPTFKIQYG